MRKLLRSALVVASLLPAAHALAFGGENLLSSRWCDWHHNVLSRYAAAEAGFHRNLVTEGINEEPIDSAAAEVGWHTSFLDSYAYNPLYWVMDAPKRFAVAGAHHHELINLHFDDLFSTPQIRYTYYQYTTGTVAGLLHAKTLYDSGRREEAVAMARHLVGVSLHAVQDFYSHSNWIDSPDRRTETWFAQFTNKRPALAGTPLYTGAYERPAHVGVHSHGIMSPLMSGLNQIRGVMDILSSPVSPFREMPIMEFWRKNKDNVQSITPGVLPGDGAPTLTEGLLTPPSQTFVGIPPNLLVVAPPGIALDASYLRNIAVAQRGLIDINGDQAFRLAYQRAFDASVQWLKRLERTMIAQPNGVSLWMAVKQAPPTGQHTNSFEDFSRLGFQYIASGPYPYDSARAQTLLPNANSVPPTEIYLRVNLTTSTDLFSGTDADIKLRADGKEFLLDYSPVHDQGLAQAIFMYNDFEGGLSTTYTVGPFDRVPATIELFNDSADMGQVLLALASDFGNAIVSLFVGIGDFFSNLVGAKADYVGQNRMLWSAQDLAGIGPGWSGFSKIINGGDEGKYTVTGQIRRTGTNATENIFQVQLLTLRCDAESTIDQLKLDYPGDEPFLVAALVPLPGTVRPQRTGVLIWARSGHTGVLRAPMANESKKLRDPRTGPLDFDWQDIRVPKSHGMLSVPMGVWESDDETSADRDRIRDEFAGVADGKTKTTRENFLSTLGRATAAGWKLDTIRVDAFARGGSVGYGNVLSERPNAWIEGRQRRLFVLNPSGLRPSGIDPSSLQMLWDSTEPSPGGGAQPPPLIGTIKPDVPTKLPPAGGGKPPPVEPKREPLKVLLVDDDVTDNNHPLAPLRDKLSAADTFYREHLKKREIEHDIHVVNYTEDGPDAAKLAKYNMVIWYTGASGGNPRDAGDLSMADQATLAAWVKGGSGRTLILVSSPYMSNVQGYVASAPSNEAKWIVTDSDFLKSTLGARGGQMYISRFVPGIVRDAAGKEFTVTDKPELRVSFSVINPNTAKPLYFFECDPDLKGKRAVPIATWNRLGSNIAAYLGFPLENVDIDSDKIFDRLMELHTASPPPRNLLRLF